MKISLAIHESVTPARSMVVKSMIAARLSWYREQCLIFSASTYRLQDTGALAKRKDLVQFELRTTCRGGGMADAADLKSVVAQQAIHLPASPHLSQLSRKMRNQLWFRTVNKEDAVRVLLAIDESAASQEAVNEVSRRLWPTDTTGKRLTMVSQARIMVGRSAKDSAIRRTRVSAIRFLFTKTTG